jgi:predicted methyltransferase
MLLLWWLLACHKGPPPENAAVVDNRPAVDYAALVAAPDRTDADRALDAGRKPATLLELIGVRPGMKVADLGAGGGYTTELLARAVGPSGVVYGQNSPLILERFAAKPWAERLARPADANVVRADLPFDSPLPPEAKDLDAVVMVLFYHDSVWMGVDRAKMNAAIYSALKPGGVYVVLDHAAKAGDGIADVQTLHRIERSVVESEVEAAGFKLQASSDAWANPADAHDWNDNPGASGERRGTSDRFALRFVKPG